ncbi:MAG: glycosyl hydrolase [Tepidisphaeraceae bacterium]
MTQQTTALVSSATTCLLVIAAGHALGAKDALREGWESPPESTKPHVYWYWLNNVVTKTGITLDLEFMAKVGIGGAYIGQIGFSGPDVDTPQNATSVPLSEAYYDQFLHAIREGLRTGVKIGLFNGPGWSQSGGPWVRPEESMMRIDSAEVRVMGGLRVDLALPRVPHAILDVRTIAFPAPRDDGQTLKVARFTSEPDLAATRPADGKADPATTKDPGRTLRLTFELEKSSTVRSLQITHASGVQAAGTVFASRDGVHFDVVHAFRLDRRSGPVTQVQVRNHPSIVSIPPTTARFFRVDLPLSMMGEASRGLPAITFSSAARVESAEEKQLNVASRFITPPWDAFVFPPTPEPGPEMVISPDRVLDLTANVDAAGRLTWDAPAGEWVVQRFSTVSTGAGNGPAPASLRGLEIDKMSRAAAAHHIEAGTVGQVWKRLTPDERKGFNFAIADSYEKGFENWTPGLEGEFKTRLGYDPVPYLPVLGGRVVGSAAASVRFLWDLRRLVADLIAQNYVGGLRDSVHPLGLKLWLENYGHYGFPSEFLSYGGQTDGVGGEYWLNKPTSLMETRGAASSAHIYGKSIVSAESFTSAGSLTEQPGDLKTRGDLGFAIGVNHYVLHVVSHQPTEVPGPGMQLLWGTYFNRKSLWFAEHGKAWVDYVRRSCFLLQQGRPVADVAYFIGEDVPQMDCVRQPALPPGYDYDAINADVLMNRASVHDGRLTLPGGAVYRVLVLPPSETMRPQTIEKIAQLVRDGLTVVGPAPKRSPSLEDFAHADARVQRVVADLWPVGDARQRAVGLGHVWQNASLTEVLNSVGAPPAVLESDVSVLWKQRSTPDAEIFFLSNQTDHDVNITPSFNVSGRTPQVWDAETGNVQTLAVFREDGGRTMVPLTLRKSQAVFLVFRRSKRPPAAVKDVRLDDQSIESWTEPPRDTVLPSVDSNISHSFWAMPSSTIRLPEQSLRLTDLKGQRWVVPPPRGDVASGGGGRSRDPNGAVVGISVGRNGVVAFQRTSNGSQAVLVWHAIQPITDWTHFCVAYQAGVPHLYVNGRFMQVGLKTGHWLLAGDESTSEGTDLGSPFEPAVRGVVTRGLPLSETDIANTAKAGPPHTHAVQVTRNGDGLLHLTSAEAGRFTCQLADGRTASADVAAPPAPLTIAGPWKMSFDGPAAPLPCVWDRLHSWSEDADPSTKYFSGSATYHTTVDLPSDFDPKRTQTVLNLGRVSDVARVEVNGKPVGTALRDPYIIDVSPYLTAGSNTLSILVTSNWANRMIGDEQFPDDLSDLRAADGNLNRWPDWAFTGAARPEPRRITLSARRVFDKNSPLSPSGLIGPVKLEFSNVVLLTPAGH